MADEAFEKFMAALAEEALALPTDEYIAFVDGMFGPPPNGDVDPSGWAPPPPGVAPAEPQVAPAPTSPPTAPVPHVTDAEEDDS